MGVHRVLIVEDDEDIRESLIDFLRDHGYDAVGAGNGRDALDRLSVDALPPSVIILDLMMPIMDGRMFRDQQLRHPAFSGIPVVVISAHNDISGAGIDPGVVNLLPKPLDLSALLEALQRVCAPV